MVALTSVGETVHKLTLRIIGCLIGALIGMILTAFYIIPNISDIFQLMVLIFFCLYLQPGLPPVMNVSLMLACTSRFSLLPTQTLTWLFKPSFDMDVVSDRILGIFIRQYCYVCHFYSSLAREYRQYNIQNSSPRFLDDYTKLRCSPIKVSV